MRSGAVAPPLLTERLLAWQREQRSARLVEFRIADAPEPEAPSEAQLARFHENNADRFSAPEYREAGVAVLNAAILIPTMGVSEAEIEEAYASHRARYEVAERRHLQQVVAPDQAAAAAIAAEWTGGADMTGARGLFRPRHRRPRRAPAARTGRCGLRAGAGRGLGAGAVALRLAPCCARVAIEPGLTRPLAEVRDELLLEIQTEKAADAGFARSSAIEDALAGGAALPNTTE